jgi:hypothetical protein
VAAEFVERDITTNIEKELAAIHPPVPVETT